MCIQNVKYNVAVRGLLRIYDVLAANRRVKFNVNSLARQEHISRAYVSQLSQVHEAELKIYRVTVIYPSCLRLFGKQSFP